MLIYTLFLIFFQGHPDLNPNHASALTAVGLVSQLRFLSTRDLTPSLLQSYALTSLLIADISPYAVIPVPLSLLPPQKVLGPVHRKSTFPTRAPDSPFLLSSFPSL